MFKFENITDAVQITRNRVNEFSGTKPYLATGDLVGGKIKNPEIVNYSTRPSRADLLVNEGDIIVARMQNTKKVFLFGSEAKNYIVSTGFLTVKPKPEYLGQFLFHYFQSSQFQREKDRFCFGATQKAINNNQFKKLKAPKYSIQKQKKICFKLDRALSISNKSQRQMNLLDDYIKAIFLKMFGNPVKNEMGWDIKSFGEVCPTRLGKMLDLKKQTGKNKRYYLGNANVLWGRFNLKDLSIMCFNEKEMEQLRLKKGDVLICEGGDVGRTAIWQEEIEECYFQKAIHRGKPRLTIILAEYILFLMQFYSISGGFKDYVTSATIAHLTGVKLKSMSVPVPPLNKQKEFAAIYNDAKELKQKINKSFMQMNNYYNALTYKYFEANNV